MVKVYKKEINRYFFCKQFRFYLVPSPDNTANETKIQKRNITEARVGRKV